MWSRQGPPRPNTLDIAEARAFELPFQAFQDQVVRFREAAILCDPLRSIRISRRQRRELDHHESSDGQPSQPRPAALSLGGGSASIRHNHAADGREEFHILPEADELVRSLGRHRGFAVDLSHLSVVGVCRTCAEV